MSFLKKDDILAIPAIFQFLNETVFLTLKNSVFQCFNTFVPQFNNGKMNE